MTRFNTHIKVGIAKLKSHLHPTFLKHQKSNPMALDQQAMGEVFVFIRSWNRPLYLWACLDSLQRNTSYPCHFVLIDNASTDPLVREVVAGFQRRQFFHHVHFMDQNSPTNQKLVYVKYRSQLGKYFFLLDGDISIEKSSPCWLETMIGVAEKRAKLAVLGALVDKEDFVDPKWAATAMPELDVNQLSQLIKLKSPERRANFSSAEVINPYKPPGRLLLLRTEAVEKFGLPMGNKALCDAAHAAGYQSGVATGVMHRHLSLLNLFDYPDHDFLQLNRYLSGS